jgi:protein-tyrosine phosphatase|tara:strand:- start:6033 stop:6809 length:777 start_codon:yes stop_codon:yes gene_type:complete
VNFSLAHEHGRFVDIDGAINFRDFGGYETRRGGCVRWGRLYRCGSLHRIQSSDYQLFSELDIGVICDLRRLDEAEEAPAVESPPFDCRVHIPIAPGSAMGTAEDIPDDVTGDDLRLFMASMTGEIAKSHHSDYTLLFEQLMKTESGFLLHCSAGKDRTGFGAALILAALDVDDELIYQDYMLSNHGIDSGAEARSRLEKIFGFELDEDMFQALAGVYPEYLKEAYTEVHKLHGSMLGYLDAIGIDDSVRRKLQERLVE